MMMMMMMMHYLPENTSVNFELVLFKIYPILYNVDQIYSTALYCVSLERYCWVSVFVVGVRDWDED